MPSGEVLPGFKQKRGDDRLGEIVVGFAFFGMGTLFMILAALVGCFGYAMVCLTRLYPC